MKKILCILSLLAMCIGVFNNAFADTLINGAGATFPYPLYSRWAFDYAKKTGLKLNYQSIGSGGGIKQIQSSTVDFGASDAPLGAGELQKSALFQFPMAIGGVVPVVNISGVKPGELKLTPDVLAEIFLGHITEWNDKRIADVNPGLKLPEQKITVAHRSDGSGTTWIFTNYLDKVSKPWRDAVGFGTAVNWPAGVGGKGNEGVATYVKRIKGTIGYVEYAYALQNSLAHVKLRNRENIFVEPSMDSFIAAASAAEWTEVAGFAVVLTDQLGKNSWPIAGATYIIVHKNPSNCDNAKSVLEFFDWAYKSGAETAKSLDYVPIPKKVYELMEMSWSKEIKCAGKPLWSR